MAGMCLTNNDDYAFKLRQLRVHGENPKYYHQWVGLNSRLDTLQAAVLSVKLDFLEGWSKGRRANAEFYNEHLKNVPGIRIPYIDPKAVSIYNQYTLVCEKRDELMAYLKKKKSAVPSIILYLYIYRSVLVLLVIKKEICLWLKSFLLKFFPSLFIRSSQMNKSNMFVKQ